MRNLKIFTNDIEDSALLQIDTLLNQEPFKDCKVRIMPDVHAGAGCVIGFTANLGDKVIPNIVGVDIGCGMLTVNLGKIDVDFEKLDSVIREHVPSGQNVHEEFDYVDDIDYLHCYKQLKNVSWLHASRGTLGGGNHFIEIDVASDGTKYLVIHTGSRNLGKQVADIYQNIAINRFYDTKDQRNELIAKLKAEGREKEIFAALKEFKAVNPSIPKELCYLEGDDRDHYLHDMRICQYFAWTNRMQIASTICKYMGWKMNEYFHTVHNYIDESNMIRKGAISAKAGEKILIPMNMRDGSILAVGKGNEDWNYSAPHGAGRIMSRAKAREIIDLDEYARTMSGIFTTSVCKETIDEAPQAYKPMKEIIDCIKDTVDILEIIKPLYNFKASD